MKELQLLYEKTATQNILSVIRSSHTVFVYASKAIGDGYELQSVENPGHVKSLFLYKKLTDQGTPHYDIFHIR